MRGEKFTPVEEFILGEVNKDKLRNLQDLEHRLYQRNFNYTTQNTDYNKSEEKKARKGSKRYRKLKLISKTS